MNNLLKSIRYGAICTLIGVAFIGLIALASKFLMWVSRISWLPSWAVILMMMFVLMTGFHYMLNSKWFFAWIRRLDFRK